ncbi:MAG: DUF2119 domain-containing protein [Candidatus Syntrophoarchaeum sp.]|nr:DUF2119 domain-containing protein [Candidatus Syntrophoarchaeum sp.]
MVDSEIDLYQLSSSHKGPTKLLVGGLHGREATHTAPILEELINTSEKRTCTGVSIIVPSLVKNSKYLHVISQDYYQTREGMRLITLIENYRPSFYLELHAYRKSSYSGLTDPQRERRVGVPPFIDLEEGILLGSIAPILMSRFGENDLCITIEVPSWKSEKVKDEILEILKLLLKKKTRDDVADELRLKYPSQIRKAEELFKAYYRDRLKLF